MNERLSLLFGPRQSVGVVSVSEGKLDRSKQKGRMHLLRLKTDDGGSHGTIFKRKENRVGSPESDFIFNCKQWVFVIVVNYEEVDR